MRNFIRRLGSGRKPCSRHRVHLQVECLDDRTVPSTLTLVNTLDDPTTYDLKDSVVSLREAIALANDTTLSPGADTIGFNTAEIDFSIPDQKIQLQSALPVLSTDIDIEGPGANLLTVRRNTGGYYRIFTVSSGATVTLSGLKITDGSARTNLSDSGSGIANSGTLTLNNVVISSNQVPGSGVAGGIYNGGNLTLNNSTVSGNDGGGGAGGIENDGVLTLNYSTVSGNRAGWTGGGILNTGVLTLNYSTVSGNTADAWGEGGGIWNADTGTLMLNNSTVSGNTALIAGVGGGIFNNGTATVTASTINGNYTDWACGGIGNHGKLTLNNSTVSGNSVPQDGGGIYNYSDGTVMATNCTIANNSATYSGGGIWNGGTATLNNTIVANSPSGGDVFNTDTLSGSYNLIGGGSGGLSADNHNLLGSPTSPLDPLLAPLGDYGGPTQTMALLPGSPAIDKGSNELAVDPSTGQPLTTDQRGLTRIVDGNQDGTRTIDIGAYELESTPSMASTTTSLIASPNPSVYGQAVTFTAMVAPVSPATGTPTRTVNFYLDGSTTAFGTGTLNAGQATFTTTTLAVGNHTITAAYGGDSNFARSTSSLLTQTVNKANTTTALTSSSNTSVYGQVVTFTATVTANAPGAGTPTGTVTFKDGGVALPNGTVSVTTVGGQQVATYTTSALSVATHSITAVYVGDTNNQGSTSTPISQVVNRARTTTKLTSSPNLSAPGQSVTFKATVSVVAPGTGTPTGTVTFKDGTTTLGTRTLNGGVATFSTSALSAGSYSITAVYGGDNNDQGSTAAAISQVVKKRYR